MILPPRLVKQVQEALDRLKEFCRDPDQEALLVRSWDWVRVHYSQQDPFSVKDLLRGRK